ncbi:MAG: hypothetical protein M1830_007602, partial [Pleopsidium flavum]
TEFVQGSKTRRWGVAWSWGDMRPRMDVARGISTLPKHLLPFPSEYAFTPTHPIPTVVGQRIDASMKSLSVQWQWRTATLTGVGFAEQNVWSRAARRRKTNQDFPGNDNLLRDRADEEDEMAFGFKIQAKPREDSKGVEVVIRWLKGNDSVLFESFCGMLKRQIEKG